MSTPLSTAPPMDGPDLAAVLRMALHGQNAPLHVQYTWAMLHLLPQPVAAHPGSREFRSAQRDFWTGRGIALDATRRDIEAGLSFLTRHGLLPTFVEREGN